MCVGILALDNLEANSNLRKLEAQYSFVQDITKDRAGCTAILDIISLAPSSLREVTLQFLGVHPNDLWRQDTLDWARVELVLSRLEKLESVVFDFGNMVPDGDGNYNNSSPNAEDIDLVQSLDLKAPLLAAKGVTYLRMNSVMLKVRQDEEAPVA